jgi:hypothetical protein
MVNKSSEASLQNEQEEFENVFEVLRKQLLAASVHLYIWEKLWPTEEVVDIINRYKGFFRPTIDAHLDRLIIKVNDILSNKSTAPSFYRILNMIGRNPNIAPDIDVHDIKRRLKKHKKTSEAIEDYRNKRVAHWDTSIEKLDKPVFLGNTRRMLKDLEAIFNRISSSHSGKPWAFRYVEQADTTSLLDALTRE